MKSVDRCDFKKWESGAK